MRYGRGTRSPERRAETLGRAAAILLAMGLTVAGARPLQAQAGRSKVEEGNRLYSQGRFQEAYDRYLEALREDPGSALIQFNQGNALYQNAEFQRALDAYRQAIESGDPGLASAAWYNLGNAFYRAQELEQSAEAYKQALRANPTDTDAKYNLERVLEQMQQQDQQQNQDQQNNQDQQDQQDQQNQGQNDQPQDQNQDDEQDQQEQNQQDQQDQNDQQQGQQNQDDEQDQQGQAPQQPQDQPMSREEAERLLQAVRENPEDVNRKPPQAVGQIPRKKW